MSWVDIVIAIAVIGATERGLKVGVFRQVGSLVGFMTGFVIGVLIAPSLALHVNSSPGRPLVAAMIVTFFVLLGSFVGRRLGSMANLALRRLKLGTFDKVGGAIFAAVGTLMACWLVASLLVNVSLGSLSSAIASSRLLAVMDRVMPGVPSVEARVQALFRSADFPGVFASVVPPAVPTVQLPTNAATRAAVDGAAAAVLKITALNACGLDHEGSGFVVAPNVVVTAAHVVAGSRTVLVNGRAARVTVFDPRNDVAVLVLSTRQLPVIGLLRATPASHTAAAVVGYPQNGSLTITRAAIAGTLTAQGRDIYDGVLVTRQLVVVSATVQPGNSGSPLLVGGAAAGLIFSKSVAQGNVAYAVPADVVRRDTAGAATRATVNTGTCISD